MNRRMFIATMIGGLVSVATGKPIIEACTKVKVTPKEVEDFEPRLITIPAKQLKFGLWTHQIHHGEMYYLLQESIHQRGLLMPITVNRDFTIIDGNHRGMACQELDMEMMVQVLQINLTDDEFIELQTISNTIRRV